MCASENGHFTPSSAKGFEWRVHLGGGGLSADRLEVIYLNETASTGPRNVGLGPRS